MLANRITNNIQKQANSVNNDLRELKFSSHDIRDNGEHNSIGLVGIYKLFVTHDEFLFETAAVDLV